MDQRWHRSQIAAVAMLACFSFASVTLADGLGESPTDHTQPYRHEHPAWSVTVFPAVYGALGVDDGGSGADGGTELGGSIRIDKSLSNSMSLAGGITIGARRQADDRGNSYMFELTPTFIAPWRQHDRMFIGLGAAVLGISERNEKTDWGLGPRISLGMDYAISNRICAVLEGNAGVAYLGGQRSHSDMVSVLGNGAAWGRLMLGARFGL